MYGFADGVISSKRKRDIADPARYQCTGTLLFDLTGSLYEIEAIIIVRIYPRCYRKNVGVKYDIFRRESQLLRQQL